MALVITLVYVLHQDLWLWRTVRPLVFGFLPAGLAYHAAYTVGISLLMVLLVRYCWPSHLDGDERRRTGEDPPYRVRPE